jgi:DNA-binding transcriptional ArsR family regulator
MEAEPTTTITDVAVMRAMAHPVRVALLDYLTSSGSATATECAEVVSLTPSATSYHLRALAKVGMVEEAPGRGDGRERFWRSTVVSLRLEGGPDPDPEIREAKRELMDTFILWEDALLRRYLTKANDEPKEWQDASIFSGATLVVTAEELVEINEALHAVIRPYYKRRRSDPPSDARSVFTVIRSFPTG